MKKELQTPKQLEIRFDFFCSDFGYEGEEIKRIRFNRVSDHCP